MLPKFQVKRGDRGQVVKDLQDRLVIYPDSIFGGVTEAAVKEYQMARGLVPTGIADALVLGNMTPQLGVDISHNNQAIDWDLLSDLSWVAIKLTEGQDWLDPKCYGLVTLAKAHKISTLLGYHFATPDNSVDDPVKEARFYWEHAKALGITNHVLDLESNKGLSREDLINWADKWLQCIADWSGKTPILYTGHAFIKYQLGGGGKLVKYPLWVARYHGEDKVDPGDIGDWERWYAWQFTGSGRIPAVRGRVDLNWIAS